MIPEQHLNTFAEYLYNTYVEIIPPDFENLDFTLDGEDIPGTKEYIIYQWKIIAKRHRKNPEDYIKITICQAYITKELIDSVDLNSKINIETFPKWSFEQYNTSSKIQIINHFDEIKNLILSKL